MGGVLGNTQHGGTTSLVAIQVLRAIAALLVLVEHASNESLRKIGSSLIANGPFGVDIFFVISGFVMVYSSERLFGQPRAPAKFLSRRIARIVPVYWVATSVFVWFSVPYASTKAVFGSLFFAPHLPREAPLLLVGWTLIFEMFFYAVFAIALFAKHRLAVVASATLFLILFAFFGPAPNTTPSVFWSPPFSNSRGYLSDPIIIEFAFGMMIALVFRAGVRLSIETTMILIIVALIWFMETVPSIPRQYSCGIAAALIV